MNEDPMVSINEHSTNQNNTDVVSVGIENNWWTGKVNGESGHVTVKVNSVSSLFARSLALRNEHKA